MPAHTKDDLRRLIHSLDRTEVGYVKKYWSRYSSDPDQDYVILFDVIRGLDDPSPQTLKEAVRGFPWAHRLSSVKNYCMQRLLDALRAYSMSSTPARRIQELLDDADLLLDHGLYTEAEKRASKALALAAALEVFIPWLRALAWLKRFRQLVRNAYEDSPRNPDLNAEQRRVLQLYHNSLDYEEMGNAMHKHLVRSSAGDRVSAKWLDTILDAPLLQSPDQALSHSAAANFYLLRCNWYRMHKVDAESAFAEASALETLRRSEPEFFAARTELNETSWYTYLFCALEARRPDVYLQDADAFYAWTNAVRIERTITRATRSWMLESNYALYEQSYDRLLQIEPSLRYFYRHQGEQITPHNRVVLVFTMVRAGVECAADAMRVYWTRELMDLDDAVRPDLHAAAMLYDLMHAVEANDTEFLRSRTRSLQRYARKHLGASALLERTLSFFRRVPDSTPNKVRQMGREMAAAFRSAPPLPMFDPVGTSAISRWFETRYAAASENAGDPASR